MTELRTTALHDRHEALGASFTDFGGWLMPVRYTSDLAEHHAVRTAAGLFDISHMAEFLVEGPDAGAFLDYALAGRLSALVDDQAKYSLLLDADGGIVDDVIVYRHHADRLMVVANAGNRDAVAAAFTDRSAGYDVTIDDATDRIALIAVQGPASQAILEATPQIGAPRTPYDELKYYRMTHADFTPAGEDAVPMHIGRTGYTGEDGFELYIRASAAPELWDALLAAGAPRGLVPAGLAARDTLRLEAGMPLYGHELSLDIVPAQAGLGRVVAADKPEFVGKRALAAVVAPDAPVLVGLVAEGRRAGRAGYVVLDEAGETVGEITSGALSPTLGHPIAMAFVTPTSSALDTQLFIDVRGTRIPAIVTALPFYQRAR
ncbi:glycine cleavage system aminomethyltransferase GcvT [Microbacterium sp. NEAU-LLC]|uniref:Aminomethyltransferase n=1 Tax=Microbacterium helvum TaxID=2773713 RepID=A0ABR8NPF3_9MICO|nr:glycine cleavage system aminomethyltransferase GcvT [Microbacterium helvum]MBD3942317.1 glycine cleavage system aminomethyltransferase GcvT [Microbacterium helvum]